MTDTGVHLPTGPEDAKKDSTAFNSADGGAAMGMGHDWNVAMNIEDAEAQAGRGSQGGN